MNRLTANARGGAENTPTGIIRAALSRLCGYFLLGLTMATTLSAQTGGAAPPNNAAGRPAGSYQLSGYDNVNLFNGNFNFSLPLLQVGGRGGVQIPVSLRIDSTRWKLERDGGIANDSATLNLNPDSSIQAVTYITEVSDGTNTWICRCSAEGVSFLSALGTITHQVVIDRTGGGLIDSTGALTNPRYYILDPNGWQGAQPGYGPGVLQSRIALHRSGRTNLITSTLTRVVFTAPDGTEYELRDRATYGRPFRAGDTNPSRGNVFVSADGAAMTFVSDTATPEGDEEANTSCAATSVDESLRVFNTSGYLLFADGTRYRVQCGLVSWIRDRNGNLTTFVYDSGGRVTSITDSLNRVVTIAYYDRPDPADATKTVRDYDEIGYGGVGNQPRSIKVRHKRLSESGVLRADFPTGELYRTHGKLFPEYEQATGGKVFDTDVVRAVELPDGRRYELLYDNHGEIARVVLPTGGAVEYDYHSASGSTSTQRAVWRRRVYQEGGGVTQSGEIGTPTLTQTYKAVLTGDLNEQPYGTTVTVEQWQGRDDATDTLLTRERHYFNGRANSVQMGFYPPAKEGREEKTETLDTSGDAATASVLRTVTLDLRQRPVTDGTQEGWNNYIPRDLRVAETVTTLENGLSSKQTSVDPSDPTQVRIDRFNNVRESWEYDFDGKLLRHGKTDYSEDAQYTEYTGPHLRRLVTGQSVYDAGGVARARSSFEYDNYAPDAGLKHDALVARVNITGLCTTFDRAGACANSNPGGYLTRGNVTKTTNYLLVGGQETGSVSTYRQYDVAGNAVKSIDARGYASTVDFSDNFGKPDAESRLNSAPAGLGGKTSFAFPTKVTNALGHTAYAQYDYSTGLAVNSEDANGTVGSVCYDDALGRPTRVEQAANDPAWHSQMTFHYDDSNRKITTTSDQSAYGDNVLKGETFYDGLGRTTESRQYEGGEQYIAVVTKYDALGRAARVSNPYRPGAQQAEASVWTVVEYDALGRVVSTTTPDGARVVTAYDGASVLVTDQAGRQRLSLADAVGRLRQVWEIRSADAETEAISFPGKPEVAAGYRTGYDYDVLGNLIEVSQGAQKRSFRYSSLGQLISAKNPESGTVNYEYDENGNLSRKTDARGVAITYEYDALSRPIFVDYSNTPINPDVERYYDNPAAGSFGKGRFWHNYAGGDANQGAQVEHTAVDAYDPLGRPREMRQLFKTNGAWGPTYGVRRSYDLAGDVLSQTYPSGHTIDYSYDGAGRLSDSGSAPAFAGNLGDGTKRVYAQGVFYDDAGRLREESFGTDTPLYHKLHYNVRGQLYDVRLSTVASSADQWNWNRGAIVNYYDAGCSLWGGSDATNNGNLRCSESAVPLSPEGTYTAGNNSNYTSSYSTYSYDALNRLTSAAEQTYKHGAGLIPSFTQNFDYDRWGNRTISAAATTDGVNKKQFDLRELPDTNRLYAPGDLDAGKPEGARLMRYDPAGNLVYDAYTGAGLRTFDAENRMTSAQGSSVLAGTYTNSYVYDANGQRTRRRQESGETWQVYGFGGELLAEYAGGSAPSTPRKEYGYRSGKLLVVAEPPSLTATAPTGLSAAPAVGGARVKIGWSAAAGAAGYRVERSTSKDGPYTLLGTTTTTSFTDSGVGAWQAYLYRVCAANQSGECTSEYGGASFAVAAGFTDPTIITFADDPSGKTVTTVKAAHVLELRQAVDAVRQLAGLGAAGWRDGVTARVTYVRASHVQELRDRLGEALSALGITVPSYTDPTLWTGPPNWTAVKRAHVAEMRIAATRGGGVTTGGEAGTKATIQWLIADHLGTPRIVADQTGSLAGIKRHDYLPFGEEVGVGVGGRTQQQGYSQFDGVRQGFTGYEKDSETGLNFAQARYYSSTMGRFTSVDPIVISLDFLNPQAWNHYIYSFNNPLVHVDPNGKWPVETHYQMIRKAFPGLSRQEVRQIMKGSHDTDLKNGVPVTLIPSQAYKHAMTPPGKTKEEARELALGWIHDRGVAAQKAQTEERGTGGSLSLKGLYAFGEGAHTIMDNTSPTHRELQEYKFPSILENGPIGAPSRFIRENLEHREGESREPTEGEMNQAIWDMRDYFRRVYGEEAYERAINKRAPGRAGRAFAPHTNDSTNSRRQ